MKEILSIIKESLPEIALRFVIAFIVLIVGIKAVNILIKLLKKGKSFSILQKTAQSFIASFLSCALKIAVVLAFVAILGVPMSSMIALITSVGVAIGLALQGSLSNFCGGLMILIFKPFVVGDFIQSGDKEGYVKYINIFYTTLCDYNNVVSIIPNAELSNSDIRNLFCNEYRRIELNFAVSYGSDIKKAREVILNTALADEKVVAKHGDLVNKDTKAVVINLDSSSVTVCLKAWCRSEDFWDVRFRLSQNVKLALEENGIKIPFPQLDVHIDK